MNYIVFLPVDSRWGFKIKFQMFTQQDDEELSYFCLCGTWSMSASRRMTLYLCLLVALSWVQFFQQINRIFAGKQPDFPLLLLN